MYLPQEGELFSAVRALKALLDAELGLLKPVKQVLDIR